MSTARDILRAHLAPRETLARRMAVAGSEASALATLMAACLLIFVGQWPRLARQAHLGEGPDLQALIAGALFAWLFVVPLAMYLAALVVFWFLRVLGFGTTAPAVRQALFWGLLAATPAILLNGLVAGLIGPGPALTATGTLALGLLIYFWVTGLVHVVTREATA